MGFFGSGDKKTTAIDSRIGASDSAIVAASGSASARDDATSVATGAGSNSNVGGTQVQGSNLTSLSNSLQNSNNYGTITYGETGLGAKFAETVERLTEKNNASLASFVNGTTQAVLPNAATDLPRSTADEETTSDKLKTWLPLIAAALAVAFYLFRKK